MRILELSLRNYRVFEEVDLELPARVIGIFGENGSGKSSLMESIAFAMYGVDAARTKKQAIRTHGILTDCLVRVAFEHGWQQYEVRRSLKGRGHTPEAELYGGGLLIASGTTEVDAEVQRLLHMDLRVFKASVYAEQKQLDAFSEVTPAKRKDMALRLLGIRPVDDARRMAREEAKRTKLSVQQLAQAVADIAELEARLKEAKEEAAEATARARAAADELRAATAAAEGARKAFEEMDAARQRIEKLLAVLREKTGERDRLVGRRNELAGRVERLREEQEGLPALQEELDGLGDADGRLRAGERLLDAAGKLEAAEGKLAALPEVDTVEVLAELEAAQAALSEGQEAASDAEAARRHRAELLSVAEARLSRASEADPSEPCPTCGRPLGDDFAGYVRHCEEEVARAKAAAASAEQAAAAARAALDEASALHRAAAKAADDLKGVEAGRAQLSDQVASLTAEIAALAEPFAGETPDLHALAGRAERGKELAARVAALRAEGKHLSQAEEDLASTERSLVKLEDELTALADEASSTSFDQAEHAGLRERLRDADAELERVRALEREAGDAAKESSARVRELEGELRQAGETAARVAELRSEGRHVERVVILLDGFRDHLVSRVGPELSREAEAVFRELTGSEYDDLRIDEETLTIQIADGDTYHPIGRFSGSETDLANLALRIAISTHLSRVSGADVGLMVLDEVLASLDEERKDLMVRTLGRLSSWFHQLFVITHAERVKDQFPAAIEVRKAGRRRSVATLI